MTQNIVRGRLHISLADKADQGKLSKLAIEALRGSSDIDRSSLSGCLEYSRESCAAFLGSENSVILVAEIDKKAIGFIHSQINYGVGWLNWIAIVPKYRRKNIAWYLWMQMFVELKNRGVHKIWGSISSQNHNSIKMAEKIGFETIGFVPNFWNGEDHLLVERELVSAAIKDSDLCSP